MADLDRVAVRVSDGIRNTLSRVSSLALGLAVLTFVIGSATFATGLWVFDGSTGWLVVGGAICFAPTVAALLAWIYVHATVKVASGLLGDVQTVMAESGSAKNVLVEYDTDDRIVRTARRFDPLQVDLRKRSKELPALYAGVRAICSVPALAGIALVGMLFVGALGTILLLAGLID
ncbi:MAG TPA: hypothetical protein VHQ23_11400 [Ilumatobacteraceae bacterium]|nr:hypothetical protein [Ilumatobacteraceae bacterium]